MGRVLVVLLFFTIISCLHVPGESCTGRRVLTDTTGVISDGEGEYPKYARCEWLIDAKVPNKTIYLEFEELDSECSYDFIFVYDGNSFQDKVLASISGTHKPDPIMAHSGQMLVYLFSDRNYQRPGFLARYMVQDCPMNCSNQGSCVEHQCHCFDGRWGNSCEFVECPSNCSDHGTCVADNNTSISNCKCDDGYSGYMCNISLNNSEGSEYWYEIAPSGTGFNSRSSHAGALLPLTNCLYIFGGFSLNEILNDLVRFCFDENRWETITETSVWPEGRYEHRIVQFEHGFYMFGGILTNLSYSNELWYYNASSNNWTLCAQNSSVYPLRLSGHTLTLVEDDLYLFGGKTEDGQFLSNIYKINGHNPDQWVKVIPLGGKSALRRLVGHSTVYHKESKSLLIYGGYSYSQDQSRFGSHTNNIHVFHVENRIWSKINLDLKLQEVPEQRSFHSAVIIGNYMVIYGGNSHIHHKLELCYDYDMYLYHLGCHSWISVKYLLAKYSAVRETMEHKGRVSHVAVAAYGNILLVSGGYSGYVRGDLVAFKFPAFIAPPDSEVDLDLDYCTTYTSSEKCLYNPDCIYCNNLSTTNTSGCLHRTLQDQCGNNGIQKSNVMCPGICGRLSTCLECLSQGQGATLTDTSLQRRTYIQPCNWCVKEGQCQQRSMPEGNCVLANNTVTGIVGWWGGTSASLSQIDQCRLEDFPAGLHAIKYRPRGNSSHPDEVKILQETKESETFRHIYVRGEGNDIVSWKGFIHPLNATIKIIQESVKYSLRLIAEKISVELFLSNDEHRSNRLSIGTVLNSPARQDQKDFSSRRNGSPLFPNRSRGYKYYMEVTGEHKYPDYSETMKVDSQMYDLQLKWNGRAEQFNFDLKNYHTFSSEFLEPYNNGSCSVHDNCLSCMTDSLCGWCDQQHVCVQRNSSDAACSGDDEKMIMITEPSVCPMCSDHVECSTCSADPHCEWVKSLVYCVRRGRAKEDLAVRQPSECPASCHLRVTCSTCLNISECAWCENLRTCLPFSDYVSRYRHGQCTEWIDSEIANSNNPYTCRNCSSLKTCDQCLKTFSCGWCGNRVNPTIGICFEGDFAGPYGEDTCSKLVSASYENLTNVQPADWSYSNCPDVEECLLGMAQCHPDAECINTPTSYKCSCKRGFNGDGNTSCTKTCYHKCVHGYCMEYDGEFICDCNLGWTGDDCGTDCKCNGHSMCENGTGKCDYCLNGTTGPYCDQCLTGHYGEPKERDGCFGCRCNKHGNESKGLCHSLTGHCFCMDNTEGVECQTCQKGYYGDPRNGGNCYLSCDHGLIIENITYGSVGSYSGPGVSTWRAYCLWIFTIYSDINNRWTPIKDTTISFIMEDMAVQCERDHVYVYDGIPKFIDSEGDGTLLGAFCGFYSREFHQVLAKSGIVTVYFDADISGDFTSTRGFNGSYFVNSCSEVCDENRNQLCNHTKCECMEGYSGFPDCHKHHCQTGCVYQKENSSCVCEWAWGRSSYKITVYPWDSVIPTDFPDGGPVSRYGHTLIYCDDDMMYLFGGRSLQRGLLNDIWQFSFSTATWTMINAMTNDKPSPRYFHAGECVPIRKTLYIFGGLIESPYEHRSSKEMWKFAIDAKKWTGPLEPNWVKPVAGHTMTRVEGTKLVIIGGFSTSGYFNDIMYIYDANKYLNSWDEQKVGNLSGPAGAKLSAIYGHTAVYHEFYKTIYIFGGHVYTDEILSVSDRVYTYSVKEKSFNVLPPARMSIVEPRYFHSAVMLNDLMIVIGGLTENKNTSTDILIYKFKCNYWLYLDISGNPLGKAVSSLVAAAVIVHDNSIYIHGGVSRVPSSAMYQLQLPRDICSIHNTTSECEVQPGCYNGEVHVGSTGSNTTNCTTHPSRCIWGGNWSRHIKCEEITNCSECVATYPQFQNAEPFCSWCGNCPIGKCVPQGYYCEYHHKCEVIPATNTTSRTISPVSLCPASSCEASTCDTCKEKGCLWTRYVKRVPSDEAEFGRRVSENGDWTCVLRTFEKKLITNGYSFVEEGGTSDICPVPCFQHRSCARCLKSYGGEGGSRECYWSESLIECIAPAYLSLHCLGGTCGTVLQGLKRDGDKCPASCSMYKKCADCRQAQGCGWCAYGGENGQGACMSGTMSGPANQGMCEQKNSEKTTNVLERDPQWAYAKCPPENECENGHHNCDLETQNCNDELSGFSCTCKKGYINRTDENGRLICTPVCHQGCDQGLCIQPDTCKCLFGYVGENCSTKCECNGHSNCESVEKKDFCLECRNNTQGQFCQQCKPLYVGDPKHGGKCVSCTSFCHEHSDVCLYFTNYSRYKDEINKLLQRYPNTRSDEFTRMFSRIQPIGPEQKNHTICLECSDYTHGDRCEMCRGGYFRLPRMPPTDPCTKCLCNGHSDTCDRESGLHCQCKNNTETRCNNDDNKDTKCHKLQCAECKEYFIGQPTDGHHCYRQMSVNRDYCFDPFTQEECSRNPTALNIGRTVFFVVQPKYVNVDIRVTVDVSVGGIDVYFSPRDDTFKVKVQPSGFHEVTLNPNRLYSRARTDIVAHNAMQISDPVKEVKAKGINTFITVEDPDTVLMIRNLRGRLVVTLPNDRLNLKTSRFYMVFLSTGNVIKNETSGNLYFRQDQPHIDLFVFFSVFFSCFFLFLAMCVLLWKTKQGFDARRTRQQRAREMLHMASRPFAKVLVFVNHSMSPLNISPNLRNRGRKPTDRTPLLPSETGVPMSPIVVRDSLNIVPIAIEPTDDGVAAIGTVVFQLPGGVNAPSQLCLGSTLTNQLSHSSTAGKLRRPPVYSNC